MRGLILLSLLMAIPFAKAQGGDPVSLTHDPQCTLEAVLNRMGYAPDPAKPVPPVFLASQIPLEQFQDAVEEQWGFRPHVVLNVYVAEKNEIYLMDDSEYYKKVNRFIDDSLAHEYAHYVQVKYRGVRPEDGSDHLETEAVQVQTWFRETYMKTGLSPCR